MVILDTDHMTILQQDETPSAQRLRERLARLTETPATTIVTFEEQTRGWLVFIKRANSGTRRVEAYRRFQEHLNFYRIIPVLPFDEAADAEYQRLERLRLRIGSMDLRIAAIALARGATLLSRNLSDFRAVPGLDVEDWTV